MIDAYARVSTREQNEARQLDALTAAGIARRDLYLDKQSGKDFDRPQYKLLLRNVFENEHSFRYAITCRIRIIP